MLRSRELIDNVKRIKVVLDTLLKNIKDKDSVYSKVKSLYTDSDALTWDVRSYMFGGFETSIKSTQNILKNLSENPKVLEKLYEELEEKLVKGWEYKNVNLEEELTIDVMNDLIYASNVVKENLRLHPAGPCSLPYGTYEDFKTNDIIITKGTMI